MKEGLKKTRVIAMSEYEIYSKIIAEALGYDPRLAPSMEMMLEEIKALRKSPISGPMGLAVQCSKCDERVWRYEIVDRVKNECYRCRILKLEGEIMLLKQGSLHLPFLIEQILQDEGKTIEVEGLERAIQHAIDVVVALRDCRDTATAVATHCLTREMEDYDIDLVKWGTEVVSKSTEEDDDDK